VKVAFINASPRKNNSISLQLLRAMEERLPGCEIVRGWDSVPGGADAIVVAFPLYVDGIPSNLLRELAAREQGLPPGARVYAMVNNGFYEGAQNAHAISMLRNWCARAKLAWGQGVGVGGGGMLSSRKPGRGPLKSVGAALDAMAANILTGTGGEDLYTSPDIPRALYKLGGAMGLRAQGRKNGLTKQEMARKL